MGNAGRQLVLRRLALYSFTKSKPVQHNKIQAGPPVVTSSLNSMTGINRLPKETLHEIVSYLSTDFSLLLKCSLICRGLSEVANATLYRDINLTIFNQNDGEAAAKNQRRQLRLLGSISEYLYSTHIIYHY
jgi:F-box-like